MTQYTKKAFITGAAKGLGRATAVALSTSGYKTILTDMDPVELAETQKIIEDAGGSAVQNIYDNYDYGISFDYGTDAYSIGLWTSLENSAGYEVALAYTGIENFTAKAIWSDFTDADVAYEKSTFLSIGICFCCLSA